jgi:DNA-damage-inducible protein D
MEQDSTVSLFEQKHIRRIWHDEQWYFSIVDIIEALTDSPIPRTYWSKLKAKINKESKLNPIWVQLKMLASDGKNYKTDCANTEGVLRIVMSVSSPKAEPFKLWLAQVGRERIEEYENPEIGFERLKEIYAAKGYSEEWIERRLKSISVRKELTDEWKGRGVKQGLEYSILTAEIAKATFGLKPNEHAKLKGLDKENLRDHMTTLELIFTMLGEESTRRMAVKDNSQGFEENYDAALKGGNAAGGALKRYESLSGESVVSSENFLNQIKEAENNNTPMIGNEEVKKE